MRGTEQGYSYYYGTEAEQFNFFRLPKKLIRDRKFDSLSSDAKILYGVLLDRMTLSMKNQWIDEENRIYIIFTIEDIAEELGCGKRKAIMLMNELDVRSGIGLIERKRQGQGKPNLIYVRNFNKEQEGVNDTTIDSSVRKRIPVSKKIIVHSSGEGLHVSEVQECAPLEVQECAPLEVQECAPLEVQECASLEVQDHAPHNNETEYSKTNNIYNNLSINPSVYHSGQEEGWMDRKLVEKTLKKRWDYDFILADSPHKRKLLEDILMLATDACCSTAERLFISGNDIPVQEIRIRFMNLTIEHIRYLLYCIDRNSTVIKNIKAYILTCLYNAPATMSLFYDSELKTGG